MFGTVAAVAAACLQAPPAASAALRDSDRDGLSDRFERTRSFTNPRQADTDREGLTDGFELQTSQTSPRDRDTDGDGLSDRDERRSFWTDPRVFDTDGDGTGDGLEVLLGRDPLEPDPAVPPPPDTAAPETTIGSGPSGTVASASASVAFSSSEPGSSFECRLDAAVWSACSSPQAYSSLANGPHSFSVRARDQAGNTDPTPATRAWTVSVPPLPDTAAPETTIGSGPSGTVASASGSFAFSSSEPGSSFECRLDAAVWSACSSPQAYSSLANGPHSFSVRARDQAGNTDPTPATRDWTVSQAPSGTVTLTPVDGGTGYYSRFSNPLPTSPDYFPVGVWGAYNFTAENVAKDKAVGLNLYVWNADTAAWAQQNIAAAGMRTIQDVGNGQANIGGHTAGWLLGDELDMSMTPSQGLSAMQARENQAKASGDNRALYTNYGKGVLFGWANGSRLTPAQREQYINDFQELVSSDFYWYTDPWQSSTGLSPDDTWLPEGATGATSISGQQVRRASNYGYQIDKMRSLDAADGQRKPIWAFVEVGSPFTPGEGDGVIRQITPAQIRAAVWHSLIAGARGVIYFQHSFSGSCQTHHVLRGDVPGCYAATINGVTSLNAQIANLAPVLNAPSVTSGTTTSSGVRALYKWHDGHFYVFAGNRDHAAKSATLGVSCVGNATAVKLGEGGESIPVVAGTFSDTFANGEAVHVYRIDGGTSCGLSG